MHHPGWQLKDHLWWWKQQHQGHQSIGAHCLSTLSDVSMIHSHFITIFMISHKGLSKHSAWWKFLPESVLKKGFSAIHSWHHLPLYSLRWFRRVPGWREFVQHHREWSLFGHSIWKINGCFLPYSISCCSKVHVLLFMCLWSTDQMVNKDIHVACHNFQIICESLHILS